MTNVLENIIEGNETILWKGKPDWKSAIFLVSRAFLPLIIFGSIFSIAMSSGEGTCEINGEPVPIEECNNAIKTVLIVVDFLLVLGSVFAYLGYLVTRYAITDKRIIKKSGLVGADITSVYYEQIKSLHVDVGLIGKIFGTGNILIDTGRIATVQGNKGESQTAYNKLVVIEKPYEVYKLLQENQSIVKNSMHSGRADYKYNTEEYKNFIQDTEKMKQEVNINQS